MGSGESKLSNQDIIDYQDLTYLSKAQVLRAYKRMQIEVERAGRDSRQNENMYFTLEEFCRMPEIQYNPFGDRIFNVFNRKGDNKLTFEDYLDLVSVFSESADKSVKTAYAFRIYDLDNDNRLDTGDLSQLIVRLTNPTQLGGLSSAEIDKIVQFIMKEADLDEDQHISLTEFELVVSRSPDFIKYYNIAHLSFILTAPLTFPKQRLI